jgi:hypothetical protein
VEEVMRATYLRVVMLSVVVGMVTSSVASGQNGAEVQTVEAIGTKANPCAGDLVKFNGGRTLLLSHSTMPGGGIHIQLKITTTAEGLGAPSGDYYTIYENSGFELNVHQPFESTEIIDERVVSRSGTQNFTMHSTLHLTVNANGVPTAFVDNTHTSCDVP